MIGSSFSGCSSGAEWKEAPENSNRGVRFCPKKQIRIDFGHSGVNREWPGSGVDAVPKEGCVRPGPAVSLHSTAG
jgi:hypothetical protein